jgi:hypothetical protein
VINGTVFVARTVGPIALAYWMRDAEASTSSDASAQCYGVPEDIRVFAMVVAKLKLIQIQREIFLTDVMVGADNATLQERPERFEIVGMHLPAHVLMRFVIALRTNRERVSVEVSSMTLQMTLPLREIAPMTVVLPDGPRPNCFLSQWRLRFKPPM